MPGRIDPRVENPRRRALSLRLLLPLTYLALVGFSVGGLILWAGLRIQADRLTQIGSELEVQASLIAGGVEAPFVRWEETYHELSDDFHDDAELEDEDHSDDHEDDEDDDEAYPVDPPPLPDITLDDALIRLVNTSAENTGGIVTLTDAALNVLYSSDQVYLGKSLEMTPEFTTHIQDIRTDNSTGERKLYVAEPVFRSGGSLLGYVQLSIPMSLVVRQNLQTWSGLLFSGGLIFMLTILISAALASFILRPVKQLRKGAAAAASGDLSTRVQPVGPEEFRQLADAFNIMTARLSDLLARQRDFVAHAAHELRTPLTSLSLRLEMIIEHGRSDPELAGHYLTRMAEEITHLRRLTGQLMDLAALDAHDQPSRREIDLAFMLYQLADEFGLLMKQSAHVLRIEVPPHLPVAMVHEDQIRAAVRNLLDNAVKYTEPGGTIILSAAHEGGWLKISISDTGKGIPEQMHQRVFDRFFRVDQARGRKTAGAGLGLALVKEIMSAHGGEVQMTSHTGQGSCFTLVLPVHQVRQSGESQR